MVFGKWNLEKWSKKIICLFFVKYNYKCYLFSYILMLLFLGNLEGKLKINGLIKKR